MDTIWIFFNLFGFFNLLLYNKTITVIAWERERKRERSTHSIGVRISQGPRASMQNWPVGPLRQGSLRSCPCHSHPESGPWHKSKDNFIKIYSWIDTRELTHANLTPKRLKCKLETNLLLNHREYSFSLIKKFVPEARMLLSLRWDTWNPDLIISSPEVRTKRGTEFGDT